MKGYGESKNVILGTVVNDYAMKFGICKTIETACHEKLMALNVTYIIKIII